MTQRSGLPAGGFAAGQRVYVPRFGRWGRVTGCRPRSGGGWLYRISLADGVTLLAQDGALMTGSFGRLRRQYPPPL